MRQVLSTAIVAVIVSLLTLTVAGAMAQTEPAGERTVDTAALNADKVDGKHAVSYTNKKGVRRGKLVATNKQGELPANIVRPFWGYLQNVPPGFADGVDNEGVMGVKLTLVQTDPVTAAAGTFAQNRAICPAGARPVGGGWSGSGQMVGDISRPYFDNPTYGDYWYAHAQNAGAGDSNYVVFAVCLSVSPGSSVAVASRG